jgi:hypothetical protein
MAGVFLSYDREDLPRARSLALALERAGHSVWWDRHIKGGAQYSNEIEQALKRAEAVVVLWSRNSIDSAWVRDEAAAARDAGRLVPARLDPSEPPLGFRQYHTIDLSRWKGGSRIPKLAELLSAIEALSSEAPTEPATTHVSREASAPLRLIALALFTLALIAAALFLWKPWLARSAMPVVSVAASSQSEAARAIAQDLFVRLGAAQSGRLASVQLVREGAGANPDLILEVSGTQSAATLALLRASDRQLLSSQELVAPPGRTEDLKPSLEIAAAATVDCAADSLSARARLPLAALKDYLHACVRFDSLYGTEDVYILIPQLEQMVRREPRFIPAWKLLLLAGSHMRSIPTDNAKPSEQWLRSMIARARQIDASMPELRLAVLQLLPNNDFTNRISLVDSVRNANPDNLFALGSRAEQLMLVGRNIEAVEDSERSAMLKPLSPYGRSEYVRTLAFSGRVDRAFGEMKALKTLDDVARNVTETRFRLNLRYGDPRSSLALYRKYGTSRMHEAFLQARIEPTPANQQRAIGLARAGAARQGYYSAFAEVLSAFGRDDEVFQTLMSVPPENVDQFLLQTLFRPTLNRLREKPRFLQIAKLYGLLDYWRTSGNWPDFCSEPDLPYDCKVEAAKLG